MMNFRFPSINNMSTSNQVESVEFNCKDVSCLCHSCDTDWYCQNKACHDEWLRLTKEIGSSLDDTDYCYFHCMIEGCHDISLGKTSFPCDECGHFTCQSCSNEHMFDNDEDQFLCEECYKYSK